MQYRRPPDARVVAKLGRGVVKIGKPFMRGRKPKPTTIKVLEGNPGRRPLNDREPQAPPGIPECPEFLGEEARAEWFRMAMVLTNMGLLTLADRSAFTTYCVACGRWVEAETCATMVGPVDRWATLCLSSAWRNSWGAFYDRENPAESPSCSNSQIE